MASLEEIVKTGDYDAVTAFLTTADTQSFSTKLALYDGLSAAVEEGFARIVALLLQHVAPSSSSMHIAVLHGHAEVVEMLLNDGRADPSDQLYYAVQDGHVGIVELLLQDPRVDVAEDASRLVKSAVRRGHTDVALLLLTDGRTASEGLLAICTSAIIWGDHKIVERLLQDERVYNQITIEDMCLQIRIAAGRRNVGVLQMLLACPKASDLSAADIAHAASVAKEVDAVTMLSQHKSFQASFDRFKMFREGRHAVVAWLLQNTEMILPAILLFQKVYDDAELLEMVLLSSHRFRLVTYLRHNERFLLPGDIMLRQVILKDDVNEWIRGHLTDAPPKANRWMPQGGPGFWQRMEELDELNKRSSSRYSIDS